MKNLSKTAKSVRRRPVLVRWIDSASSDVGWMDEGDTVEPLECVTLGWLIEKSKTKLVISATIAGPESSTFQAHAPMAIPRNAVISWRYV